MLEFHDNAIVLSGETGTGLKSEIVGKYYKLWWKITSGGDKNSHSFKTTIVELNAGSGQNYISDTNKIIFGSSGHALQLKNDLAINSPLSIILFESDDECYSRLKNVIAENWPKLHYSENEINLNNDVHIFNNDLTNFFEIFDSSNLGNSLFFFDPLLNVRWIDIEALAKNRIKEYYETRTEFIIFLFTSDWFFGRGELQPLPATNNEMLWSIGERNSVLKVDELFGNVSWRNSILLDIPVEEKMKKMIDLYKIRLHRWFRYVLPLPFQPKKNQTYHLIMCTNHAGGANITKTLYKSSTKNRTHPIDNKETYDRFLSKHPEKRISNKIRSLEWKILNAIIKNHEEGLCDVYCSDFVKFELDATKRLDALSWLSSMGYLDQIPAMTTAWNNIPKLYKLNWSVVKRILGISPNPELKPLTKDTLQTSDQVVNCGLDQFF